MKQVIVFNSDAVMTIGKMIAQGAHGSLGSVMNTPMTDRVIWFQVGQKKVVLKTNLSDLLEIQKKAVENKLPNILIKDAGHTELPYGTVTCLAIGPAQDDKIDALTGRLSLL